MRKKHDRASCWQPPHDRTKREVRNLLSETIITEIEAQDESELHSKRMLSIVLSETKRIAEQLVDALRSATTVVNDAGASAQVRVVGAQLHPPGMKALQSWQGINNREAMVILLTRLCSFDSDSLST